MDYTITKPNLCDISSMRNLVLPEVKKGIILDRSEDEMANAIRSYSIIRIDGNIIAFSALHIHSMQLGEIRSLVVKDEYRRKGLALALIKYLLDEAMAIQLREVLTLTYKREVFEKIGFKEIAKDKLPNHKIWTDCVKCTHFPICDEIALIKAL